LQTPQKYHFVSDSFIVVTPWQGINDFHPCHPASQVDSSYRRYYPPLFAHLFSTIRIDTTRVCMFGECWGGALVYKLASLYPDIPSSLMLWTINMPAYGCCDTTKACVLKNIPLNIVHGDKDTYDPWQNGKAVYDAISRCGGNNAHWYLAAGTSHESWMWGPYNDQDTMWYRWTLAQRKGAMSTSVVAEPRLTSPKNPATGNQISSGRSPRAWISDNDEVEVLDLRGHVLSRGTGNLMRAVVPRLIHGIRVVRIAHGNESVLRMATGK
jgi:hypothetical protein